MTQPALAAELMSTAVCHTSHPADAAAVLMLAAGEVLHAKFGPAGALKLMRSILDDTEAAINDLAAQQPGEPVQ